MKLLRVKSVKGELDEAALLALSRITFALPCPEVITFDVILPANRLFPGGIGHGNNFQRDGSRNRTKNAASWTPRGPVSAKFAKGVEKDKNLTCQVASRPRLEATLQPPVVLKDDRGESSACRREGSSPNVRKTSWW